VIGSQERLTVAEKNSRNTTWRKRISTASPNVVSVPVQELMEFSEAQ